MTAPVHIPMSLEQTSTAIRVVLVESHNLVRAGLRLVLDSEPGIEVVYEAKTVADAVALTSEPDVVIADLMLTDARGIAVVERLVARFAGAKILVVTMVDDVYTVRQAMNAGASGYLLKEATPAELTLCIRTVVAGDEYIQPALGALLAHDASSVRELLSDREHEVLRLIALGHTNAEIGATLSVALRTVEAHRGRAMQKLGLRTRAELVRYALEHGYV